MVKGPQKAKVTRNFTYKSVVGLLIMGRPVDGVIIGSTAVLGMIIALRELPSFSQMVFGLVGGIFLLAGMDTFNDYRDVEMDKISKPWRPLPQGTVTLNLALFAAIVETIVAITIGVLFFNYQVLFVGVFVIFLAVAYSKWLKSFFPAKNLIVAFSLSLAFVGGALSVTVNPEIDLVFLLVQLLTFVSALVFEIHKDLADYKGDSIHQIKTLPTQLGLQLSTKLIILGYLCSWFIAALIGILLGLDSIYVTILFLAFLLLSSVFFLLIRDPIKNCEITRRITTIIMGFILLGLANQVIQSFRLT